MTTASRSFRFGISAKLGMIVVVAILGLVGASGYNLRENMEASRKARTQALVEHVELASSLALDFETREKSGALDHDTAQAAAKAALAAMRYGKGDYVFVLDRDYKMIMHPINPKLDGTSVRDMKDPDGRYLFVEMMESLKGNTVGWGSYKWPKPGEPTPAPKLSVVKPGPWGWVIGTGVYVDDLVAQDRAAMWTTGVGLIAIAVLLLLISVPTALSMVHPLRTLTDAMRRISGGDTSTAVPSLTRSDEIGDMARALGVFKQNMDHVEALRSERAAEASARDARRKQELAALADRFEAQVKCVVDEVARSSQSLETASSELAGSARSVAERSGDVAGRADVSAQNVAIVNRAAEELANSIEDISRQAEQSNDVAVTTQERSGETRRAVGRLADTTTQINEIVVSIRAIAEQTNLLALNATIEAARAGEAGRGFAIVAQEVKALAVQTAKATEDISQRVASVQETTSQAVSAIAEVDATVGQISEASQAIAAAVHQQRMVVQEISRSMNEVAGSTQQVSLNVEAVRQESQRTTATAEASQNMAVALKRDAARLDREVATFLGSVRAG